MYDECLKALYGTLDAELLFWTKLITDLDIWGFKTNQYNCFVIKKYTERKKYKILWYVDCWNSCPEIDNLHQLIQKLENSHQKFIHVKDRPCQN